MNVTTFWGHLHVWSLKTKGICDDIGFHTYNHDKPPGTTNDRDYHLSRQKWSESQKIMWNVKNKRPEKIKDHLSEIEDLLLANQIIQVKWRNARLVQVLLSNSTLISILVAKHSGDIEKIFIDKSLSTKLTDKIYTGIWCETFMVLSFCDKSKICCIHFGRKLSSDFQKLEKLATLEAKVTYIDLPGHAGRRLNRHLMMNTSEELVGIWWSSATEEAWPWSPVASDHARANIIVLNTASGKFDDLIYFRTECDPIFVSFSCQDPRQLLTVECTPNNTEDIRIDSCVYQVNQNNMLRLSVTSLALKAAVSCQAWNFKEDKLLLGCKDKSLMLYDCHRVLTQTTTIPFIPVKLQWHPAGSIVFVFSILGDLQMFDMALASVHFQLATDYLHEISYFKMTDYLTDVKLAHVQWSCDVPLHTVLDGTVMCHDNLLMVFQDKPLLCNLRLELGSLSQGRLGAQELIQEYIKHDEIDQAVNFVNSINWNNDGNTCFACLSIVMNYLLKFPLTDEREGLLEETLGCFYTPSRLLTDVTVLKFRDPLSRWSRRFFYHLLRYRRFPKAFMLAVDIGAADLFMDLHFIALDSGNISLAENAKNKALEIDSELLSTETDDSETENEDGDYPVANNMVTPKSVQNHEQKESIPAPTSSNISHHTTTTTIPQTVNIDHTLTPLHSNITHNQAVWELANNIELVTTENEEDVIYL